MTASDPHSLTLRRMLASDHPAVAALTVADEQKPFVDPMPLTLETTGLQRDNFVVETDASIAGFFQINTRPPDYIEQPLLELCQVLIDKSQQGHGLGKKLIQRLPKVLKREYPDASGIVLTVNCRNKLAYHVYQAGGFCDTGDIYTGGPSGPQHIMSMCWDTGSAQ
ncbi:MAG: GNAT family N-acetyltransferase [Pseudomonadota bacterium]